MHQPHRSHRVAAIPIGKYAVMIGMMGTGIPMVVSCDKSVASSAITSVSDDASTMVDTPVVAALIVANRQIQVYSDNESDMQEELHQ